MLLHSGADRAKGRRVRSRIDAYSNVDRIRSRFTFHNAPSSAMMWLENDHVPICFSLSGLQKGVQPDSPHRRRREGRRNLSILRRQAGEPAYSSVFRRYLPEKLGDLAALMVAKLLDLCTRLHTGSSRGRNSPIPEERDAEGDTCFANYRITHRRFRTRPRGPGYLQALSPLRRPEQRPAGLL